MNRLFNRVVASPEGPSAVAAIFVLGAVAAYYYLGYTLVLMTDANRIIRTADSDIAANVVFDRNEFYQMKVNVLAILYSAFYAFRTSTVVTSVYLAVSFIKGRESRQLFVFFVI